MMVQSIKERILKFCFTFQARFVKEVCSGELIVSNRKRKDILEELQDKGYEPFLPEKSKAVGVTEDDDGIEEEEISDSELAKGYDYLLGMKIWSLTFEKAEQLLAELSAKTEALEELKGTSPAQIWLKDLDAIEIALDDRDAAFKEAQQDEVKAQQKNQKRTAKKKATKSKKKTDDWDSDENSSDGKMDVDSIESAGLAKKMQSRLHVSPPLENHSINDIKKRPASPVLDQSQSASVRQRNLNTKVAKIGLASGKPAPRKKQSGQAKTKATSQMKVLDESSESDDDFNFKSDDNDLLPASSGQPVRPRGGRSRKPVVYAMEEDSDDESSH